MESAQAATELIALEAQRDTRREAVWAGMGKAPLAHALLPMVSVARAMLQPAVGGSVAHQAAV